MKLASYNVENLFQRARAMNQDTWQQGKAVLKMSKIDIAQLRAASEG